MKLPRVSFFWRILSAFVLCGMAPLFLLSVVFTGAVEHVIEKNNYRRAAESVESVRLVADSFVQTAIRTAEHLSASAAVIGYCANGDAASPAAQSLLVSDIFQETRLYAEDDDFQIYVIPADGRPVLSKKTIPAQYELASYGGWGVFNAARSELNRTDGCSPYVLFGQPHPDSGNQTVAAVIVPVYGTAAPAAALSRAQDGFPAGVTGFVIVDILRKGFASRITQIAGLQGALDTLLLYDKNRCVLYSHFSLETESTFFDPAPDFGTETAATHVARSPLSGLSVYGGQPEIGTVQFVRDLRSVALLIAFLTAGISFFAAVLFSRSITRPVEALARAMRKAESGDLSVRCEEPYADASQTDEMSFLIRCFNRMVGRIGRQVDDIVEQQKRLRIAEVKTLQAQINPHFLYNTLNSIKSTAKLAGAHKVANMVTALGKILRYEFTPEENFAPLEKELEMARNYFEIEAYRWDGRFSLEESVDPRVTACAVPRLVIQPLVENALIHGLEEKNGAGTLRITASVEIGVRFPQQSDIVIEIRDDGRGMSEERLAALQSVLAETAESGRPQFSADAHVADAPVSADTPVPAAGNAMTDSNGIALVNTHRRLKLLYGDRYGLTVDSKRECGTVVTVRIPFGRSL